MQWTKEQEQVIHLGGRNILVSAAAGSGKTATLVERIIERVVGQGKRGSQIRGRMGHRLILTGS